MQTHCIQEEASPKGWWRDDNKGARSGRPGRGRVVILTRSCQLLFVLLLLSLTFPIATSREQPEAPAQLTTATTTTTTAKSAVEFWPFHKKNSTVVPDDDEDHQNSPAPAPPSDHNQTSDSCGLQNDCSSCYAVRLCHWCSFDQACHTMGSPHGCLRGVSCEDEDDPNNNNNNDNKKNESANNSCDAHTNCVDCSRSSKLCHWCAHDNACHEMGSVHGCITGVNCYDNAHCQRAVPEPLVLPDWTTLPYYQEQIGWIPFSIIVAVAGGSLCCLTACCCVASGVKGAYDDLADLAGGPDDDDDELIVLQEPLLDQSPSITARADPPTAAETTQQQQQQQQHQVRADHHHATVASEEIEQENQEMQQRLLHDDPSGATPEDYVRMIENEEDATATNPAAAAAMTVAPNRAVVHSVAQSRRRRHRQRGRSMQRMYNACACCYLLSVTVIAVMTVGLLYYFPHPPAFNVCNDEVAWKSLVESVTSMKVDADIQLLTSIANPNRLDVVIVDGQGSFTRHDGEMVGTLKFPPTTISGMAITDILVVATFTPERWSALSIAKEFYKGELVLTVEIDLTLRVPAIFNYERTISLQHLVEVNAKGDRSLCDCPTWSDSKRQTTQIQVPVPQWMQATLE